MTNFLPLGKRPATYDSRDLLMARYTRDVYLPLVPSRDLGHYREVTTDSAWGMLGNDVAGDCVFADAGHMTRLWNGLAGHKVIPSTREVLAAYSAVTGYNSHDPSTDQGTNMRDALNWRRTVGMKIGSALYKIGAYVAITPGDVTLLKQAIYLFQGASVGFEFPASAMDQFNSGKPWTVVKGSKVEGGHDVPIVGYNVHQDMFVCITWGQTQLVAPSFLKKYVDESYAILSTDMLKEGKTIDGFDLAELQADLPVLGGAPEPAPAPVPPAPAPTPEPTPTPVPVGDTVSRAAVLAAVEAAVNAVPATTTV